MTSTPNPEIAQQLLDRLADTATKLSRDRVLSDYEIACAFLSVGMTMAKASHGPALAAEWLRDMADHVERGEQTLHGTVN